MAFTLFLFHSSRMFFTETIALNQENQTNLDNDATPVSVVKNRTRDPNGLQVNIPGGPAEKLVIISGVNWKKTYFQSYVYSYVLGPI